jgi:hypothetical protein
LRFSVVFDDQGRGPGRAFFSRRFPKRFAGLFVQGNDERVAFVIPIDDDRIAVKRGRTAFAETVLDPLIAQVLTPLELAF